MTEDFWDTDTQWYDNWPDAGWFKPGSIAAAAGSMLAGMTVVAQPYRQFGKAAAQAAARISMHSSGPAVDLNAPVTLKPGDILTVDVKLEIS